MHFIEGAQCGLPLVYHEDGGGIVEVGRRFGVSFREDVSKALQEARDRYPELRVRVLSQAPSGDAMCAEYRRVIEHTLAGVGAVRV
jgi:hypothetical protein